MRYKSAEAQGHGGGTLYCTTCITGYPCILVGLRVVTCSCDYFKLDARVPVQSPSSSGTQMRHSASRKVMRWLGWLWWWWWWYSTQMRRTAPFDYYFLIEFPPQTYLLFSLCEPRLLFSIILFRPRFSSFLQTPFVVLTMMMTRQQQRDHHLVPFYSTATPFRITHLHVD